MTGNYEQTASVTSMLSELKWDSLECRARLTTMYKMCYGMLEGNWGNYMTYPVEKGEQGVAIILNLLCRKAIRMYLDFPFSQELFLSGTGYRVTLF